MLQCNQYMHVSTVKIILDFPLILRNEGEGELLRKLSLRFLVTRYYNNLSLFQFEIKETILWFIFGHVKSHQEVQTNKQVQRIPIFVGKDTLPKISCFSAHINEMFKHVLKFLLH